MSRCREGGCGGLLQGLDTTYGDPEGMRSDSVCLKCGRYHRSTKAHSGPMNYPADCRVCGARSSIKYRCDPEPVCKYCEMEEKLNVLLTHLAAAEKVVDAVKAWEDIGKALAEYDKAKP